MTSMLKEKHCDADTFGAGDNGIAYWIQGRYDNLHGNPSDPAHNVQ